MSQKRLQTANQANENYAYMARPKSGRGKGVLVLHAWWGLNQFLKGFCDRLAKEGFVALAPDLYHGATALTITEAKKLRSGLKRDIVSQEIIEAAEYLGSDQPGIAVVGFSLGGYWALWLADQESSPVTATVAFYATRNGDYATSRSAFQFHFAETDDYVAASGAKKLMKRLQTVGREVESYTYAGTTHWFFEQDRADAYNPQAAALAWSRTVEFLQKHS